MGSTCLAIILVFVWGFQSKGENWSAYSHEANIMWNGLFIATSAGYNLLECCEKK